MMNKKILTGVVWALFTGFAIAILVAGIVDYIAWGWPIALVMTLLILSLVFSGASAAVALVKGLARINFWLFVALASGIPVMLMFFNMGMPGTLIVYATFATSFVLIGTGVQLIRRKRAEVKNLHRILAVLSLVIGVCTLAGSLTWLLYPGKPAEMP
ncbi:MAG: hypothetical protein WCW89_05855, partial [Bacteroidales bacterium]